MVFILRKIYVITLSLLLITGCSNKENEKQQESKENSELNKYAESQKVAASKTTSIDPNMDIIDLAKCTAASMKIGQGIGVYKVWTQELERRYAKIYKDKSSKEIESYAGERISDKLKSLKDSGLETQQSFLNYYNTNCKS